MADPIGGIILTIFLSVTHVGENQGFPNTPDAAYVCGFDQASYQIDQAGTIDVVFVPSTASRFRMRSVRISNDSKTAPEYSALQVQDRSLQLNAANKTAQAIYFGVTVEDEKTGQSFECDPQVINTPRPPR